MKTIIKESHMPGMGGWGNGYVLIPRDHKLHGVHYDNIDVDVHYGLTFSNEVTEEMIERWPELSADDLGMWIVGFDTLHFGDDEYNWTKEAVLAETERLKQNLLEL